MSMHYKRLMLTLIVIFQTVLLTHFQIMIGFCSGAGTTSSKSKIQGQ